MTETKRPLKVFLCHAHADRDAVKALYTRLTNDFCKRTSKRTRGHKRTSPFQSVNP
jgi:hypothetical protein